MLLADAVDAAEVIGVALIAGSECDAAYAVNAHAVLDRPRELPSVGVGLTGGGIQGQKVLGRLFVEYA